MTEEEALAELVDMTAANDEPVLEPEQLERLLHAARRPDRGGNSPLSDPAAAAWATATAHYAGDIVQAGGRWWAATVAGTTGTGPSWPTLTGYGPTGTTVTDGGVVWVDIGGPWSPSWDLHAAAAAGWRLKAGKAAGRFTFTGDNGQRFERAQVLAHCRQMAAEHDARALTVLNVPIETGDTHAR